MTSQNFILLGIHCSACKKLTEKRIASISGVSSVTVNSDSGLAQVESKSGITTQQISSVLQDTPYKVSP